MAIINSQSILKVLASYNSWWKTGIINPSLAKSYKRFAYSEALKRITDQNLRRLVILTGTRRVGKTTIQYQIIEELLHTIDPKKIVYISMDHPMLKLSTIGDILDCYHQNIYADNDVYYFFDEIQYAKDWDKWLKSIYDMEPDTKVVATGSASPIIMKGASESGAGRWSVIQVPTLSFYEYCELKGVEKPNLTQDDNIISWATKSHYDQTQIMLKLAKLQNHLNRYLQIGGFPELVLSDNDLYAQQVLREDVVDKVIKRDLPSIYPIRNTTELERIFLYLCKVSSSIVSVDLIAKELQGVSRPTVLNYISYLESANLIFQSWPIEMSGKKVLKSSPKIYIADPAILNAVLMDETLFIDSIEMGKIIETTVYKHLASFYYKKATSIGYFRGGNKNKEIDIVVEYPNTRNILVEVKYRDNATIADDDAISEMCEEASASIVVTKKAEDYGVHHTKCGKNLIRIPAFAFLYLLGHAEKNGYKS